MPYWRDLYKKEWYEAQKRIGIVKKELKTLLPNLIIKEGFMANSVQMLLREPDSHEKGEPDLYLIQKNKPVANIEVTGTLKKDICSSPLWVRPDKVEWAINHPIPLTWIWFVYPDQQFIMLSRKIKDNQYPIEGKKLKGVLERYYIIPQKDARPPTDLKKIYRN